MSKARQRREAEQRKKLEKKAKTDASAAIHLAIKRGDIRSMVTTALGVVAKDGKEPKRSEGAKRALCSLEPRLLLLNNELEEDSSVMLRSMVLTARATESGHLQDCEGHWTMDPSVQAAALDAPSRWLMNLAAGARSWDRNEKAVGVVVATGDAGPMVGLVVLAVDGDGWWARVLADGRWIDIGSLEVVHHIVKERTMSFGMLEIDANLEELKDELRVRGINLNKEQSEGLLQVGWGWSSDMREALVGMVVRSINTWDTRAQAIKLAEMKGRVEGAIRKEKEVRSWEEKVVSLEKELLRTRGELEASRKVRGGSSQVQVLTSVKVEPKRSLSERLASELGWA